MDEFNRPIPGQSLTVEPKSLPYERPPEVTDPEQALQIHLAKLAEPKRMEAALTLLIDGLDLVTVVEGILRSGVAKGIHSLDVSLIIAPVLHEFIKTTADAVGIEYDEGFEDDTDNQLSYIRNKAMSEKMIKDMGFEPAEVAEQVEVPEEEAPKEEAPKGLMARM